MTAEIKILTRKYFLTAAIFFVFALLILFCQRMTAVSIENAVRTSAQDTLSIWNPDAPKVGQRIKIKNAGLAYTWSFSAVTKGKIVGVIFVTNVMGNAGPYTGIFLFTPQNGVRFCGLTGIVGGGLDVGKYGITTRILDARMRRLSELAFLIEGIK